MFDQNLPADFPQAYPYQLFLPHYRLFFQSVNDKDQNDRAFEF